jgi:superfamily I DNA and/or RNA helicase
LSENTKSSPPLQADHIGVMAPWRAQVWKIREALRKKALNEVDVGTVEVSLSRFHCCGPGFEDLTPRALQDFQGRECRVILISCVRSRWRFVKEDMKKGFGLMFDRKRHVEIKTLP